MAGVEAPTGTVTLVFTDVEASTALWERAPDAVRDALSRHDVVMRDALERSGGYQMRTEGDAFKGAFASPARAQRWCHEVQRALLEEIWPEEVLQLPAAAEVRDLADRVVQRGLRVRMGGHVGVPHPVVHPTTGRVDYYGPMVNETARIAAAPAGGQVVVSDALWSMAYREDPSLDAAVEDLGEQWLKGVTEPAHLWQVMPRGLEHRIFPPLKTLGAQRTNLRRPRDPFLGRQEYLARIDACRSPKQDRPGILASWPFGGELEVPAHEPQSRPSWPSCS